MAQIWDAHAAVAPHVPRLNDPRRVLLRFELLQRLWEEGLNTFRVYRTDQADQVSAFPVFVRHIHRHSGPATRLVRTHDELRRVLTALRIRGRRLRDHMIVEFCDASGPTACSGSTRRSRWARTSSPATCSRLTPLDA